MPKPNCLLRIATGAILVLHMLNSIASQTERISKSLHRHMPDHDAPMPGDVRGLESQQKADENYPWTFSACLLIKDQNMLLPEWLAFHYTVLPLRRLIVGIDPHSITDPEPILDLYSSIGMNITIWRNESEYWQDWGGNKPNDKLDFQLTNTSSWIEKRDRHRKRQRRFYAGCLQRLRDEGRTWTAVIDADEYLAFNHFDREEGAPSWCKGDATCQETYLKSIRDGNNIRTNMTGTTAVEIMDNYPEALRHQDKGVWNEVTYDNPDKPCILLSRYVFVSKEDNMGHSEPGVDDKKLNASRFHTLHYHYRASLNAAQIGKCMINAKHYDDRPIESPHRVLGDQCTANSGWAYNGMNLFRVHHYLGSWLSFRPLGIDLLGVQGGNRFQERNKKYGTNIIFDTTTGLDGKTNTSWLSRFISAVGIKAARALTEEAIERSEREKRLIEKGLTLKQYM